MTICSHGFKRLASPVVGALICAALASCTALAPSDKHGAGINVPEPEPQVQRGPNLEVASPSVSDSGPAAGTTFTLSATVRNDGSEPSAATTLRYYRSTDETITTSDTEVGTDAVVGFAASGSSSQSLDVSAPLTPGTYYYGACVDAVAGESDTTDNCSPSVQIKVPEPDLLVASPSVSNSAPAVGATFTLSATVRNVGDESSAATTLRYYRSTDATITPSDTQVGTDVVTGLDTAGSSSQSARSGRQSARLFVTSGPGTYYYHGEVELTAPSTPGTYYYGACVDAVTDESDTTNNCSSSVSITVRSSERPVQGTSDLGVYAIVILSGLDGFAPGVSFTLSAGVQNNGSGSSAAATLRYYRSTDSTITTSDSEVGTDEVPGLAPSGTSTQSVSLTAPSTPGTYYYGACVDAVTDESDTTNNCSGSLRVDVSEESQGAPDLAVAAPTVSDNGPDAGATFTLSATVRNAGDESSAATTLRFYRSTDATITPSDTQVGTDEVAGLAASGASSESVSLTAPSTPGTYYYGACVDSVTDESDTTNNCSSSVQVTVPEPDLVVSASVSNSAPAVGATFTLSATVRNDGAGSAAATTLRYYRSTDATITTSDTQVGTDAVAGLAASGTSDESVSVTAPSTAGTYYYGACVDSVTDESDTTNNCSSSVTVMVATPDLVVATPSVTDSTPDAGATFTLSATVRNDGAGSAAATTLRYYRSTDATITTSDTQVGTDAVAGLAASGTSDESVSVTAPSTAGTYYYGACVDAVTDESDTTNNCSSSVTVMVATPDLVVATPSVTDSTPDAGATFTLSATVRNDGSESSAATTLRYYRSTDATVTTSDTQVGTDAVAGLAASGTSDESVSLTAPSTAGTYYYGACVDAVTGESDTTNNCSSSVQVTVPEPGPESGPDLVVAAPTVSNNAPDAGAAFTLSAEVRNDGDEGAAATTLRYYRSTGTIITTSDRQVGTDAVAGLAASGTSGKSVSLTATLPAGTYYYGACVDAVTGESDTTNNCSSSVQVTVTAPNKPDLIIYAIVTTTNPFGGTGPGGRIGMSAGVRNQGGVASPATTVRFYQSTDATITTSDTEVGMAEVGELAASGTSSQGDDLTAPSTTGTYYYGACVDSVTDEFDTTNNCSGSIQIDVVS